MTRRSPALGLYRGVLRLCPGIAHAVARRAHHAQGADPARLAERLTGRGTLMRPPGRLIWIHAASVGEVAGIAGIAADLRRECGTEALVTTFTASGAGAVARLCGPGVLHQFLPADTPRAARAFVAHWRPDLAVFTESDMWPNLIAAAGAASVPLALVNARASRTRAAWPRLSAAVLAPFAAITAQDDAVAAGLVAIGLDPARITVTGDTKAAADPLPCDPAALHEVRQRIGCRPVWVAASTHEEDEGPVRAAHDIARQRHPDLLLVIVPRHPARGAALAADDAAPRRSQGAWPTTADPAWIADTLGETGLFYRLAPLVFMGGSFGPQGGHNPFEPAVLGAAVLTGPGIANQAAAFATLIAGGGARVVADATALGAAVADLTASAEGAAMRAAATAVMARGSDARRRTTAILKGLIGP